MLVKFWVVLPASHLDARRWYHSSLAEARERAGKLARAEHARFLVFVSVGAAEVQDPLKWEEAA